MQSPSEFPRREPLQTKAEVDEYFSHDEIQCLVCGKWFAELSHNHLFRKHDFTLDEYREHFGLPWQHGLTGQAVHERRSKASTERYLNGQTGLDTQKATQKMHSASFRPRQPYDMRQRKERFLALNGRKTPWQPEDFEKIVQRMQEQGRNLTDVCHDEDLPSYPTWNRYVEQHPELGVRAKKIGRRIRSEWKKWRVD